MKVRQEGKTKADREKVLARGAGSPGACGSPGRGVRVALAGSGSGAGLGRAGAAGPSVAARGRLSVAAVHASGARRRARAHLYFAAGSLQPQAGLALAPPLRHRELVDWPPEEQAHFPLPSRAGLGTSAPGEAPSGDEGAGEGEGATSAPGFNPCLPACKRTQPSEISSGPEWGWCCRGFQVIARVWESSGLRAW